MILYMYCHLVALILNENHINFQNCLAKLLNLNYLNINNDEYINYLKISKYDQNVAVLNI